MFQNLQETHGSRFELLRHFIPRMFESDLFAGPGMWRTVAVDAFALVLPAGMVLLDQRYAARYRKLESVEAFRTALLGDQFGLLMLVMAITGVIALLQWESLFPGRRDCLALASLPIRPGEMFAAKFTAVACFSVALVLALNLLPSLVMPAQFSSQWQQGAPYWVNAGAQLTAFCLASLFVYFGIVLLHGVLLFVVPARWFARASTWVQGGLGSALLLAALVSWRVPDWKPETLERLVSLSAWIPPLWFLGLRAYLLGDAASAGLALQASAAVVITMAGAAAAYLMSCRRYRRILLEAPTSSAVSQGSARSLLGRVLFRDPREQGIAQFIVATLARSRAHRLVMLGYLGAAAAVVLNTSLLAAAVVRNWDDPRQHVQAAVVFWPLSFSVIALAGIRHVFSLPMELSANWLFRLNESHGREAWMNAVERFVGLAVLAPVFLLTCVAAAAVMEWTMAAKLVLLQLLVALLVFEVLFNGWQQLPFACSFVPHKRSLISTLVWAMVMLMMVVPMASMLAFSLSQKGGWYVFAAILFAGAWQWARKLRRDGWGEAPLIYEDRRGEVPDLGIRG
jgi:hypothetical protein